MIGTLVLLAIAPFVGTLIAWLIVDVMDTLGLCYNQKREKVGPPTRFVATYRWKEPATR